jgi:hypothetical protein
VASTGVSTYLTREAIAATLGQVAAPASGSAFAMPFLLPLDLVAREVRPGFQMAAKGARASGIPFVGFFTPTEMLSLPCEGDFRDVQHVSAAMLADRFLPAGPMVCARQAIRRSFCWRPLSGNDIVLEKSTGKNICKKAFENLPSPSP